MQNITAEESTLQYATETEHRQLPTTPQSLLQLLIDSLPALICYIDSNERYVFANKPYKEFFGGRFSDLKGLQVSEVIGRQAYEIKRPYIQAALSGERQTYEYMASHRGETRNIKTTYVPDIEKGNLKGIFVLGIDITEQKRLERLVETRTEQLRRNRDSLQLLIDSIPAFISYVDSQQKYNLVNKHYSSFFGLLSDAIINHHCKDVLGVEGYGRVREHIEAALRGERQSYEYALPHGKETHQIRAEYIPDMENGKVKGIFVLGTDITEQKKLEQDLLSAKERVEHVIEFNPAVLYLGNAPRDMPLYHSRSTVSMTGFEPDELIGEKGDSLWESRVHPDDLGPYLAATADFLNVGHREGEYRFLHKDGSYRWIRDEANAIRDSTGNVHDIVGYWTDVTDRKRMEEELLKKNRLAAIGETAAMVGHDLRNPLQAMTTGLYLIKELTDSPLEENRKEAIAIAAALSKQIHYMDKIVADLQGYSASITAEPIEVNVKELLKEALSMVECPQGVEIVLKVEDGARVMVDPTLLKRIIVNLVTNSIQAMPNGGKITITGTKQPNTLSLAVQDTGVGIPQRDLAHLFTALFTTKPKGQGMGLAVCKRFAEALGGKITVESRVDHGSTFTVTIPTPTTPEAG